MTKIKKVIQSPLFERQKRKLKKNQISYLDKAIQLIFDNPRIGVQKTGDLKGIYIYKFKINNAQLLIGYEISKDTILLYTFGSYENFYRELKKYRYR